MRRLAIATGILVLGIGAGLAAGFYYFGNDKPTYIRTTEPVEKLVTYIGNCTAKELTLSYDGNATAPINGTSDITLILTNLSRTSRCDINGYPTMLMTDAVGNKLGEVAGKSGAETPETVTLNPNEKATVSVHLTTSSNTPGVICTNGIALYRLNLPGNNSYLTIDSRSTLWCPGFTNGPAIKS